MDFLKSINADLQEAKNHMGEREFDTYHGWKRAVKKRDPNAKIEGDKDIANAHGHGEWDGAKGVIYKDKASESVEVTEEPITEVSKKTLASYIKKASRDATEQGTEAGAAITLKKSEDWNKHVGKAVKREQGIAKAADKLADDKKDVKEDATTDTEIVNEVSKKTLASYIKKASDTANAHSYNSGRHKGKSESGETDKEYHDEWADNHNDKTKKRQKGIEKAADKLATDKLTKESTTTTLQQINELSHDKLSAYQKAAAKDHVAKAKAGKGDKAKKRANGMVKAQLKKKQLEERALTDDELEKKEHFVKSMKSKYGSFKKKYGDNAKSVLYATATKLAKNEGVFLSEFDPEIRKILIETVLTEERQVFTLKLMSQLKNMDFVEKVVDMHFTADGSSALVRTKDGNAYEINIKQAGLGDYHQPYVKQDQYKERRQKRNEERRKRFGDEPLGTFHKVKQG